jgi:hypothetical protein
MIEYTTSLISYSGLMGVLTIAAAVGLVYLTYSCFRQSILRVHPHSWREDLEIIFDGMKSVDEFDNLKTNVNEKGRLAQVVAKRLVPELMRVVFWSLGACLSVYGLVMITPSVMALYSLEWPAAIVTQVFPYAPYLLGGLFLGVPLIYSFFFRVNPQRALTAFLDREIHFGKQENKQIYLLLKLMPKAYAKHFFYFNDTYESTEPLAKVSATRFMIAALAVKRNNLLADPWESRLCLHKDPSLPATLDDIKVTMLTSQAARYGDWFQKHFESYYMQLHLGIDPPKGNDLKGKDLLGSVPLGTLENIVCGSGNVEAKHDALRVEVLSQQAIDLLQDDLGSVDIGQQKEIKRRIYTMIEVETKLFAGGPIMGLRRDGGGGGGGGGVRSRERTATGPKAEVQETMRTIKDLLCIAPLDLSNLTRESVLQHHWVVLLAEEYLLHKDKLTSLERICASDSSLKDCKDMSLEGQLVWAEEVQKQFFRDECVASITLREDDAGPSGGRGGRGGRTLVHSPCDDQGFDSEEEDCTL